MKPPERPSLLLKKVVLKKSIFISIDDECYDKVNIMVPSDTTKVYG